MNPRIVALSGPLKGSEFPITEAVLSVGRAPDNTVVLDDELVSKHHFTVWLKDGNAYLKDGDTRNGTWINGEAHSERFLKPGDRIKCGSTTFLYRELAETPDSLPKIIQDETGRNWELETLRADYSVRDPAAIYYKQASQAFLQMGISLNAIEDPIELQSRLLDSAFEVIPALRGAILLNGHRVGPDKADFVSQVCRERDFDGPADALVLSGTVLEEVYAHQHAVISNNVTPVICAPLMMPGAKTMLGVLYMEGRERKGNRFEGEHFHYIKGIAEFAVLAIRLGGKFASMSDANALLMEERPAVSGMIGNSAASQAVQEQIRKVAKYDATVLIVGETGTGKELVARGIHEMSHRKEKPFVAINCGAIPESLLESELFGHVKGGFTGATADRKGKLKMAERGTVLLDEIGEMGLESQTRLLRVLQERSFSPVGKDTEIDADIRIIAATNVDLEEAVREGRFRGDLYQRLQVVTIEMPPLRERKEDIPLLAAHFLQKYDDWRRVTVIAPDAMAAMMSYSWPGNIRELENVIQAGIINGDSETLQLEDLPKRVTESKPANSQSAGRRGSKQVRGADIRARMKVTGGDVDEAAQFHGISRAWAYRLLKENL